MQKILVNLVFVSLQAAAFEGAFWQSSLPLTVATLNDAAKPRLEFGTGIGADLWLWSWGPLIIGAGGGVYGAIPFKTGNAAVRVKPYAVFLEGRGSLGYRLRGNFISIIPFIAIKAQSGAALYHRQVQKSSSTNADLLLAMGPALGFAYWFKKWGLVLSYGATYGTKGLRQNFDFSLAMRFEPFKQ